MELQDARKLAKQTVHLSWADRKGAVLSETLYIYEVKFVPLYGPCFITDLGEIMLDRVQSAQRIAKAA